jgi:predicted MFS family arabinose efflux permease
VRAAIEKKMKEAAYKNYLLTVLLLVFAFNYVDRVALGLLQQDIKVDLGLSDTQLGFLTGIAFASFYSFMGIPIARWADRGNRVTIIAITTALWSAAVALCGIASNFLQLLLIRVGVAVGEAGCIPPAHSLIADCFTRAERPRAVAIYMLGGPLSVVIGYFLAGWLNEFAGWRMTFWVLGLTGFPLAALAWFILREPRYQRPTIEAVSVTHRAHRQVETTAAFEAHPSLKEVCVTLWTSATFRHLLLCCSLSSFFGYGIGQWQPTFFIRSYGLGTGRLGTWFAVLYGLGGLLGTYWGGELASRYAVHNERVQLKAMAVVYCSSAVLAALIYLFWVNWTRRCGRLHGHGSDVRYGSDIGAAAHARNVDRHHLSICQLDRHGTRSVGSGRVERRASAAVRGGIPALRVADGLSWVFLGRVAFVARESDRASRSGGHPVGSQWCTSESSRFELVG